MVKPPSVMTQPAGTGLGESLIGRPDTGAITVSCYKLWSVGRLGVASQLTERAVAAVILHLFLVFLDLLFHPVHGLVE
jgi:hypothetical protein